MTRSEHAAVQAAMPRSFPPTVALLWLLGSIAGWFYVRQQDIAREIALPVLIALLVELTFYFSMAWEELRSRAPRFHLLLLSPLPYLIYSVPCGVFSVRSLLLILATAAVVLYWFLVFSRNRWTDFAFVAVTAGIVLARVFPLVYARPDPKIEIAVLGQLLLIRLAATTILRERRAEGIRFGFWPQAHEWKIGALAYAAALPVVLLLQQALGFARFGLPQLPWWQIALVAAGTFFSILWVVALSEELFFRGLLQQWFDDLFGNTAAAMLASALLFGAAHLGFRQFPNWKFAVLAAVSGLFYGWAFQAGHGVRAAMVAHALLVTTWRLLFR